MVRTLAALLLACGIACGFLAIRAHADDVEPRPAPSLSGLIDAGIARIWQRDGITPAAPSSDQTFLRRVYFDATGLPPTLAEAEEFLADKRPDKRERLVDKLLADPRFGRHMADQWLGVFMRREGGREGAEPFFAQWLADQINADRGLDQVFYDIIAAEGRVEDNPPVAYYLQNRLQVTPDIAGNATRHFTGVQIQCAQCHDHMYEPQWTMAEFSGVASFFAGLRVRNNNDRRPRLGMVTDDAVDRFDPATIAARTRGMNEQQKMAFYERVRYRAPKYLLGEFSAIKDATLWRRAWARWVIDKSNAQTQRYMANRIWSFAFGRGLVNPPDDFNAVNTASHPELLEALAADLRDNGFCTKRLYRAILLSRTWQLGPTGAARAEDRPIEPWHYARSTARQLSPEQFFGALITITPQGQGLRRAVRRVDSNPWTRLIAEGQRFEVRKEEGKLRENERRVEYDFESLLQLETMYEAIPYEWIVRRRSAAAYTRQTEDDEMTQSDGFSLTIDQALMIMNGQVMSTMATAGRQSILEGVLAGGNDDAQRLRALYLTLLARVPTEAESATVLEYVKGGRPAWEDVIFALFMTTEFATNH